jgi:hypothetical protein
MTAADFGSALQLVMGADLRLRFITDHMFVAEGTVYLGGDDLIPPSAALCTVSAFGDPALRIPRVRCHERWLKHGADWHRFTDGCICVELPTRWEANVTAVSDIWTTPEAALYAAEYLISSARWLLTRHKYADEKRLTRWPPNWPQWLHGDAGFRQYERIRHAA